MGVNPAGAEGHTAPESAKRVIGRGRNLDKMEAQSLSKIKSTHCFEY